jgi:hypothetical protein
MSMAARPQNQGPRGRIKFIDAGLKSSPMNQRASTKIEPQEIESKSCYTQPVNPKLTIEVPISDLLPDAMNLGHQIRTYPLTFITIAHKIEPSPPSSPSALQ